MHQRHSIRLKGYDYSQSGFYFITICTKDRLQLFGKILEGKMELNDLGRMVEKCWMEISGHYQNAELDHFIVMPDHIHGILHINADVKSLGMCGVQMGKMGGVQNIEPLQKNNEPYRKNRYQHTIPGSIGAIVRGFKIGVTKWYRQHADGNIVWQRDFFERIIRTDIELENVRNYIDRNPIVGVQYFEPHTTVNGPQSSKYIQSRGTP